MQVTLVQVCIDDRLNHELLRIQIRTRLAELYLRSDNVYIVNEIGGNLGDNFRNTIDLMQKMGNQIVLCGVLHHDDCRAAAAGARRPLNETVAQMADFLAQRRVGCVLVSGEIYTHNNYVVWQNEQRVQFASP